ncbi:hypothetical protein EG19_00040 [Thermoanaerobaculum aquaticum]|uniref:Prepilin-type N-terminal cleavage/methylation domain-containing protein n=1 Tax=Thermoanaerobaculum aquaticum TaxID=1312852 RepID=A0A062XR19_9BACT|nr:prepilin-type N-terminal cleavage/methylation domain-containing protein [Thermoanaerobaculum aquaticum]KDA55047.1 hypothetical protein EG19_00040 [Thermoanaerobaculum aquaticum]
MKHRGFSLVELLAVLALLAFIALVVTVQVLAIIQKNELQTQAQEVKAFLQEVPQLVSKHQQPLWVFFRPTGGTGPGGILQVTRDENGTQVLRQLQIKNTIAFGLTADVKWSNWENPSSGVYRIGCDTFFRTVKVSPSAGTEQIGSQAIAVFTHQKMKTGNLRPQYVWKLYINPVWEVSVNKEWSDT